VQTIPLVDVRAEYEPLIPRLEAAFREVLESERFIRGANYWAFQEEAAACLGVKRTIGVANGTDALVLALHALGIEAGDEVICSTRRPSRSHVSAPRRCSRTSTRSRSTSTPRTPPRE
jgi:dTDP-4-amino-4,6-dideoxygalactose transaminase